MARLEEHVSQGRSPDFVALRLLQMLDGIEVAGFAPVSFRALHSFAYLGNLLAPLWDVDPLDGKVLKDGYPYYPELREAIDRMIFLGFVELLRLEPVRERNGSWTVEGEIGLSTDLARPLLGALDIFDDERRVRDFLVKLAFAIAPRADELASLVTVDVTWTDNRTGHGDVIDFAEWQDANYTLNTALAFDRLLPAGMTPSRGEKLQYYVNLLERRALARDENERHSA